MLLYMVEILEQPSFGRLTKSASIPGLLHASLQENPTKVGGFSPS